MVTGSDRSALSPGEKDRSLGSDHPVTTRDSGHGGGAVHSSLAPFGGGESDHPPVPGYRAPSRGVYLTMSV